MDMQEAREIAVRFLGGLPVSDDEVFQAGNTIRTSFCKNGVFDDDLDGPVGAADFAAHDKDLDVGTLRILVS